MNLVHILVSTKTTKLVFWSSSVRKKFKNIGESILERKKKKQEKIFL